MTDPAGQHLTPVDLDVLTLQLCQGEERARLEGHADACGDCARLRQEHEAAAQRFRDETFARTKDAVAARLAPRRRWSWLVAPAVAAAAAASLALWWRAPQPGVTAPGDLAAALALKGPGAMHVFALREGKVFSVEDGTVLLAGDAIRFFIDAGDFSYVLVVSVDGAGKANVYHPYDGARSAPVDPGGRLEVPGSILLDRAPGPERLFAVFSREPVESSAVRAALRALAGGGEQAIRRARELAMPGTTAQATLLFEKGTSPR